MKFIYFTLYSFSFYFHIKSKNESLEKKIIPRILKNKVNKILVYKCKFWHPMDDESDRFKLSKVLKR